MNLPDRHILLGMTLGAICATAIAAMGPGMTVEVFAEEPAKPAIDTSRLVKFEGRKYLVEHEDWVDTDPIATEVVKKIEGGNVSYVTISTTSTGTYSTDALFSDHVQYPGISVTELPHWYNYNRFSYWNGSSWLSFGTRGAKSFFYYNNGQTSVSQYGSRTCTSGPGYYVCD